MQIKITDLHPPMPGP